jgi:hypothetical protein
MKDFNIEDWKITRPFPLQPDKPKARTRQKRQDPFTQVSLGQIAQLNKATSAAAWRVFFYLLERHYREHHHWETEGCPTTLGNIGVGRIGVSPDSKVDGSKNLVDRLHF